MSPQRNKFNTGIWLTLEGQVQSWGRSCTSSDTLYVVKEERLIRKIRSEDILVTTLANLFLNIIIWLCCLKRRFIQSDRFWMEHSDTPKSTKLVDYALSIDELEEKTGIDFFPNLNDNLEMRLSLRIQQSVAGIGIRSPR